MLFFMPASILSLGFMTAIFSPVFAQQFNETSTLTFSATYTFTRTSTFVRTSSTNIFTTTLNTSTKTSSSYLPVYTAIEMRAIRPESIIHLQPLNANGLTFQLGSSPTAYCPFQTQEDAALCPPGNVTGINGCSMSTKVPGGQRIYLSSDGSLRYTAAHSSHMPPGSVECPLSYTAIRGSEDTMEITISGLKATGFIACPQLAGMLMPQQWMVYANIPNTTVPITNKISDCISFDVAGFVVELGHSPAAWQYL